MWHRVPVSGRCVLFNSVSPCNCNWSDQIMGAPMIRFRASSGRARPPPAAPAPASAAMGYDRATLELPQHGSVHVVGTCHLSNTSAAAAVQAIRALPTPPLAVLLELCNDRVEILNYSGRAATLPPLTLVSAAENWRTYIDPLFWFKLPFVGAEALIGSQEGYEFTCAAQAARDVGAQVRYFWLL